MKSFIVCILLFIYYYIMRNIFLTMLALFVASFGASAFAAGEYNLENVTDGQTVRGIVTSSSAVGHASVWYTEGDFKLHAAFKDLTDPKGDDFYEGWLVQRSPFKFISTGELIKSNGKYINDFTSNIDYRSYDFYVLTLEPNDGDPAPADHIFEGTVLMKDAMMKKDTHMMKKEAGDTMMKSEDKMMKDDNPKRKLLKTSVQDRLSKINLSIRKIEIILERIESLEQRLPTLNISDTKKSQYVEILTVLKEVLLEKKASMM